MRVKAVLFDLGDTLVVEKPEHHGKHVWEIDFEKVFGTDELLNILHNRYRLAIVTNTETSREQHVRLALGRAGIEQFFEAVVTSVDAGVAKPGAGIYLRALAMLGVEPSETVMVGNRVKTDIMGAKMLGIHTILLRWNNNYPETPDGEDEEPDHIVGWLMEIPEILERLKNDG